MNVMSAPPVEPGDLLDLKFLPAWVKESRATNHYDHYTAEEAPAERRGRDRDGRHKDGKFRSRERREDTRHSTSKPTVATAAERLKKQAANVAVPIELISIV